MARVTGAGAMVDFHSPDYDEDDEFDDTCIFRDEVLVEMSIKFRESFHNIRLRPLLEATANRQCRH